MELIRHKTTEGYRYGVVTQRGRKWMKIHYVAHPRPTRLPVSEERYMSPAGDLTTTQRRRFNRSVVAHGGKRGAI